MIDRGDPDRVDADVTAEALVFDRDHRRAHFRRDLVVLEPAPEARPDRDQYLAVRGPNPDRLAEIGAFLEVGIARQLAVGDADGDREQHQARRVPPR